MTFLKRFLGIILLIQITNYGFSQEFSFFIYFEDAIGNRDSLELGYDKDGNLGIDEAFGENNIIEEAYSQFDVRVTDELYARWTEQSMGTYHTKKEIIQKWSEGIIAIDIKSNNYPITATWDSTLFEDQSNIGSLITSTPPGGWWDVGSPSDLGRIILSTQSTVTFTGNIRYDGFVNNTYSYTEGVDTISVFWLAFGPEGIGVSTNEIKDTEELILFPNPSTSSKGVFIRNIGEDKIKSLRIYNFSGETVKGQFNHHSFISLEGLKNGFYCIEILMLSGRKYVKKMLVIE